MSASSAVAAGKANSGGEQVFAKNEQDVRIQGRISRVLRAIWPFKTSANMAAVTGYSERQCQFVLAGERGISLEMARRLMDSPEGFEVLTAIMGDSQQHWWRLTRLANEADRGRREIAKLEKKMAALRAQRDQLDLFS